jgi:hypothetical protein
MPRSRATTVEQYLEELPPERRAVMDAVRRLVLKSLPKGYREGINWGAITYELPLERYPDTYNGQPLAYAALAAQKDYYALYLMGAYADPAVRKALEAGFKKAGKKLDMGKSCLRFRSLDDLPLHVVARAVASTPPEELIARAEAARRPERTASKRRK